MVYFLSYVTYHGLICFAYGQAGFGETYTMMGRSELQAAGEPCESYSVFSKFTALCEKPERAVQVLNSEHQCWEYRMGI